MNYDYIAWIIPSLKSLERFSEKNLRGVFQETKAIDLIVCCIHADISCAIAVYESYISYKKFNFQKLNS